MKPSSKPINRPEFNFTLMMVRNKLGLNQREMAALTGYSQTYTSDIENFKKEPSMDVLYRYAEVSGIRPSSILVVYEAIIDKGSFDINDRTIPSYVYELMAKW